MSKNDFYVSLPSNTSMKTFPKNKQSNYTTLLEEPIILPLNFQVALVEISNFSDFKVQMGRVSFGNPFYGNFYDNRIENGLSLKDFCEKLNYEIQNNCIRTEYLFRQKIAFNLAQDIVIPMHLTNESKRLQQIFSLNVLKISNSHYEVLDLLQSSLRELLFECDGIFSQERNRFFFKNLDMLQNKFDLIVLTVPPLDEVTSSSYYIDKKIFIFNDIFLLGHGSKQNDPDKIVLLSAIDTDNTGTSAHRDNEKSEQINDNFSISEQIWLSMPCVKQLDNNTIAIEVKKNHITFDGLISKVLNNNDKETTILNYSEIYSLPSNLQLIKYILVYTDIIEAQYYGDVRASILRTVNIKSNKADNVTFFDNPHYLNCSKTRIDTINIEICDVNGNHIEFKDLFSNIYISLHFKQRNFLKIIKKKKHEFQFN